MSMSRGEFSSRFGFVMAAAGSAVGLGNIWGFPTRAASNGGAAFVLVYLCLAFCLAYPALMAELVIGRHAKSNAVKALTGLAASPWSIWAGRITGILGFITAAAILSFYSIVAGWLMAHGLASVLELLGLQEQAQWLVEFGLLRNLIFTLLFLAFTVWIVCGGVKQGIERWSARLMPVLFAILLLLIFYVLTLDGAVQGLKAYLIPDFSKAVSPSLVIDALGASFFSMSLGVGTMLIYGSYLSKKENIVTLGFSVTLIDIGIAVTAGMLIIPAMYVAQANGVAIFDGNGALLGEDTLIFNVLPSLFVEMGEVGSLISLAFFVLMSIAALTSSISMLEVPVAYTVETFSLERKSTTVSIALVVMCVSTLLIFNFSALFAWVVKISTAYVQPILGLMLCVFVGWIWHRASLLKEIQAGWPDAESSLFWKIWPSYVRFICPAVILILFLNQFLA